MQKTQELPEIGEIEWKVSWADKQVFPKLKVKVRSEIVTLGLKQKGQDVDSTHWRRPRDVKGRNGRRP